MISILLIFEIPFSEDAPHVLGLTASIVTGKMNNLAQFHEELRKLEDILDSQVITTSDLANLLKFATQPDEKTLSYQPSLIDHEISKMIVQGMNSLDNIQNQEISQIEHSDILLGIPAKRAIDEAKSSFKKFNRILAQTEKVLAELGIYHGQELLEISEKFVKEELEVRAEDSYKKRLAKEVRKTLSTLKSHVDSKLEETFATGELMKFSKFSTDKVLKLVNILENFDLEDNNGEPLDIKAIVFVQERHMAASLSSLLIRVAEMKPNSLGHLRVSFDPKLVRKVYLHLQYSLLLVIAIVL